MFAGAAPADAAPAIELSTSTFGTVRVEHAGLLPQSQVENALPVRSGDECEPSSIQLARDTLLSLFQNNGYLEARVEPQTARRDSSVDLVLRVSEGPRYRFGAARFEGLRKTRDGILRRELSFRPGDPYVRAHLFAAQSRLFSLGWFDDISVQASTTPAKTAEVLIRVSEKPGKWVKAGLGWGSEESERLSLELRQANFMRRGYKLNLSAVYSRIWLEYGGEFVNRYLFGSGVENRLGVSWRRENRDGYDLEKTVGQASLGRSLPLGMRGTLSYRLQRSVLFHFHPDIVEPASRRDLTSALALLLNRDTTSDPFFPERGSLVQARLERAGGLLGGDVHFNRASLDGASYRRLYRGLIAAVSGRAGVIHQFRPSPEVPVYERFFTGGANSVRGYRERGVGPVDGLGAPRGGNVLLGGNLELRFPLFWRFWGTVFLDGGQVDPSSELVFPARWKYGTGAGLRVRTPVGPLRLDWGHKLGPRPADESGWRLHLSLGEAF